MTVKVILICAVHEKLFRSSKERIADPIPTPSAPVKVGIEIDIHLGSIAMEVSATMLRGVLF